MEINIVSNNSTKNKELYKILAESNSFFAESFKNEKAFEMVAINFHVETSVNQYNELDYLVNPNEVLTATVKGKIFKFAVQSISEELFDMFDEQITDELDSIHNQNKENCFEVLEDKINNTFPIESLYYRIKAKEEKNITYEKQVDMLYHIVCKKELLKDIEVVKDFLSNYYEAKYSFILTIYMALPEFFYQNALKDEEVEQYIKDIIIARKGELPDISDVLKTNNFFEIEDYYFKMWDNVNVMNKGEKAIAIFKKGFTTVNMIRDFLTRYDIDFTLEYILSQKKCPEDIMMKYIDLERYQPFIVENENTTAFTLTKLYNVSMIYDHHNLVAKIYNHRNLDSMTKKNIDKRAEFIDLKNDIFSELSNMRNKHVNGLADSLKEKIDLLIIKFIENYKDQKAKIFNNEVTEFVKLLKEKDVVKHINKDNYNNLAASCSYMEQMNNELSKKRVGVLTQEELTNILMIDDPIYAEIIRSVKSIKQLEKILENELTRTVSFTKKNFKLRAVRENELFDGENSEVVREYKKGLIKYANMLLLDNKHEELLQLLSELNAQKGLILEDTVCFNKLELKEIVQIADKTLNKEIIDNVFQLRQKI